MRKRQPKLIQILILLREWDMLFNQYFDRHDPPPSLEEWLFPAVRKSQYYFEKKGVLNENLNFVQKPVSILHSILKPWDGYWTFVLFDIPQKHNSVRASIRRRLSDWGFCFFQRSVWFSPLPINSWLKQLDKQIDNFYYLTIVRGKIYRDDPRKLVAEKWQLELWRERALSWLKEVKENRGFKKGNEENFWSLILDHPKVPLSFTSSNWPLKKVIKNFIKYKFSFK